MIATRVSDEEYERYRTEIRQRIALERWALQAIALLKAPFPPERGEAVRMVIKRYASMVREARELELID